MTTASKVTLGVMGGGAALIAAAALVTSLLTISATVSGQAFLYDGSVFRWSSAQLLDANRELVSETQLDDQGKFAFTLPDAQQSYIVRGDQPGYGYAPPEYIIRAGSPNAVVFYAGPDSWFPPECQGYSTNPPNAPCYKDLTAIATDDKGNTATSPPVRTFFLPAATPTPTPAPTATATPTPLPSPTATATPTPQPTPTPTPAPVCKADQLQSTGCICPGHWIGNPKRCKL